MSKPLTIGVVMDFFRPGVIEGAGAYTRQHGLRLDARWSVRGDWMPEQPGWDGVLAQIVDMESAYRRVVALGLPVVHLASWIGERARPRVEHDYTRCGAVAVAEFARLGRVRVAAVDQRGHPINLRSLRGVRVAAARQGLADGRPRGHAAWRSRPGG